MRDYEDIIHLPRPASAHPRMALTDRAKIFAPYAALKGYEEAVSWRTRFLEKRICLSQDAQEELDRALRSLRPGDRIHVRWFEAELKGEDGELGTYRSRRGRLTGLDAQGRVLILEDETILLEDVMALTAEEGENDA